MIIIIFILTSIASLSAEVGTINKVVKYQRGAVDDSLLNNEHFPKNIFGIPSRIASKSIPENSLIEIEPIGFGGEITLEFEGKVLKNGPGIDFVIFENAFINPVNNGIFAEPAVVSVSKDGVNYIEFPFDNSTLKGLAGLTPTYGDKDPYNPEISGGDGFDLALLGLEYIKYIRIKDTTKIVSSLPKNHKYYNPEFILSGFDLDAVVGLYLDDESSSVDDSLLPVFSVSGNSISFENFLPTDNSFRIFDLLGYNIPFTINANSVFLQVRESKLVIMEFIIENKMVCKKLLLL